MLSAAPPEKLAGADPVADATREFLAGHSDAALALLAKIPAEDASQPLVLNLRGSIYLEQEKYEQAAADFQAAHEKQPALYGPHLHLGDALLRQKKWEEARAIYQNMIEQTNIIVLSERLHYALFLTHLGAKDDAGASAALVQITFPTETPAYYYAQAAAAFAHGNKEAAEKWLKTADRIFDEKQTAWFARPLYEMGWIKTKPPRVVD